MLNFSGSDLNAEALSLRFMGDFASGLIVGSGIKIKVNFRAMHTYLWAMSN